MTIQAHLISLFLFIAPLLSTEMCYFIPPSKWEIAQPKNPNGPLQIGFVNSSYNVSCPPRITLATEQNVGSSLKEYVKAVRALQEADPKMKEWRDLGSLKLDGGTGQLIEMQSPSTLGDIKIMQAIFVKNNTAYILTASALKEDFVKVRSEIFKTFQSLSVIPDITAPVKDPTKRQELKKLFSSLGSSSAELKKLQTNLKPYAHLGAYWEFLALKEGAEKIQEMQSK